MSTTLQKLHDLKQHLAQSSALVKDLIAELADGGGGTPVDPTPTPPGYLVAVVVGHEPTKPGACNAAAGLCEFKFNDWIADQMLMRQPRGIELVKVHRHPEGYGELPAKINALNPDLILSLHANGYDQEVSGTEMLYAKGSASGKRFAEILQQKVVPVLGLPDRGVKARTVRENGGHLLHNTHAAAVLAEPFFIDNSDDLAVANSKLEQLIGAYLAAIVEYHRFITRQN